MQTSALASVFTGRLTSDSPFTRKHIAIAKPIVGLTLFIDGTNARHQDAGIVADAPQKKPLDQLVTELTDATKKAQDLAVEVKESLRKSRKIGVSTTNDPKKKP